MLRALSEAGIRPDLVVGTSIGAVNGAFVAADPDAGGGTARRPVARRVPRRGVQRDRPRPGGPAGALGHPPARDRAAAQAPRRQAARQGLRGPPAAVPLRRRQHRGRDGALVQQRPADPGRHGVVRRARPAAPGRDRRRATTSTAASSTPSRSAARSRSARAPSTCCTSAGSRARSRVPTRPWEVGPRRVRDRPQAPLSRGDVGACRPASGSTCCPPAASG